MSKKPQQVQASASFYDEGNLTSQSALDMKVKLFV